MKSTPETTKKSSHYMPVPGADGKEMVPSRLTAGDTEETPDLTAAVAALTSLSASVAPPSEKEKEEEKEFTIPRTFTRSGRKRAVSFPLKLMKVLSMREFNTIISWTPSGKSFRILNSKRLVAEILPRYFRSAKYSSFTRKLHRWGFARHYQGEEAGAFYHKSFHKGAGAKVDKMACCKQEQQKPSKPSATSAQKPIVSSTPKPDDLLVRRAAPPLSCGIEPRSADCLRHVSLPLQAPMPLLSQESPGPFTTPSTSEINAAIEMVVARCLQERQEAEALQRRALELLQQEQQQRQISILLSRPAHQQQLNWTQQGIDLLRNSSYPVPIATSQKAYTPTAHPLVYPGQQPADMKLLPQTNIQGAKTA